MLPTLALTIMVAASTPTSGYSSSIKNGEVHIRFTDVAHVYGPFKLYVAANGYPDARCATCPSSGVATEYVVPPEEIFQRWLRGNRVVEVSFPLSAVGGMEYFCFTAVTLVPQEERYLCVGVCPRAANE